MQILNILKLIFMWIVTLKLTHWGRVTHICVGKLTIIGSDNGLLPDRHQAIIWTNAGILLIGPLGKKHQWNLNRNSNIFIQENAFESVACETVAILSRPECVNYIFWWNDLDIIHSQFVRMQVGSRSISKITTAYGNVWCNSFNAYWYSS